MWPLQAAQVYAGQTNWASCADGCYMSNANSSHLKKQRRLISTLRKKLCSLHDERRRANDDYNHLLAQSAQAYREAVFTITNIKKQHAYELSNAEESHCDDYSSIFAAYQYEKNTAAVLLERQAQLESEIMGLRNDLRTSSSTIPNMLFASSATWSKKG